MVVAAVVLLLTFALVFVIGDLATFKGPDGRPLPGVAQVIHVTQPYKQVSREWRPENTVVTSAPGVRFGGPDEGAQRQRRVQDLPEHPLDVEVFDDPDRLGQQVAQLVAGLSELGRRPGEAGRHLVHARGGGADQRPRRL